MAFIIDASVTLAWCFVDEVTPSTTLLLERLQHDVAWVPAIWSLEVANSLLSAERRKRLAYADITHFLELLQELPIRIDSETANKSFHEILSLAHMEGLTAYDAAYLELAMRQGMPLATKDKLLCQAATRLGVELLEMK
jgi:predicted nucleic acid-binding protein